MVEGRTLGWEGQRQRLTRAPILSEGITMVVIPSPGGAQETVGLRPEGLQPAEFSARYLDDTDQPDEIRRLGFSRF
jgi:hypothetical protein